MTAEIIRFGDYQKTCDVAPVSSDIETRLARLNALAAEVFGALRLNAHALDAAAVEYTIANAAATSCMGIQRKASFKNDTRQI